MQEKILLNKVNSKSSSNEEGYMKIDLSSESRILPLDNVVKSIDSYNQYFKEKDNSDNFRLIFTINPICSNVLFNPISEILYKEGSDDCIFIGSLGASEEYSDIDEITDYRSGYKNIGVSKNDLKRVDAIRDTSYSHKDIGNFSYHCGYDIFNNHILRKKDFKITNKLSNLTTNRKYFNTIEDYARYFNGLDIKDTLLKTTNNILSTGETPLHLYQYDNIISYRESINDNLCEIDGWFGFLNRTTLNIANYGEVSLNKCLNNKGVNEMVDMYPDRSLFSFVPKVNSYRNRLEKNWEYCLTYPYKNYYNNELINISYNNNFYNGLKCEIITNVYGDLSGKTTSEKYYDENRIIRIKTNIKNNFKEGDYLNFTFINKVGGSVISIETTSSTVRVLSIGGDDYDEKYYFNIQLSDILPYIIEEGGIVNPSNFEIRVRKYVKGVDCQYYIRLFRRIPNFNNTEVYKNGFIDETKIEEYCLNNFNSTINKIAFSENIFSDKVAQIVYNDTLNFNGLKDNLGRKLTEIYFTIIKNNKGYELWYNETPDYRNEKIEYSHCFGEVTSGFDLLPNENNYNVHKIHSISDSDAIANNISISPTPLEKNITESGSTTWEKEGIFVGDIVEFSPNELNETVLEKVYHRVNTAQRETGIKEFSNIQEGLTEVCRGVVYDEITYDDYDIFEGGSGFTVEHYQMGSGVTNNYNLQPEGYIYSPHTKIILREYEDIVQEDSHIEMLYNDDYQHIGSNDYYITGVTNYYLNIDDEVYLYDKITAERFIGIVKEVSGKYFTGIHLQIIGLPKELNEYTMYKLNPSFPMYAFELNDGSGRYIWKNIKSSKNISVNSELYNSVFTNGANYIFKEINFFMKRQDPFGDYGIREEGGFDIIEGVKKDIENIDYKTSEETTC